MKNVILKAIASITIPLLLLSISLLIYLFAKGYRLDFDNREIQRTGMISISSTPRRSNIYLDDEASGKTSRSISGIEPGNHTIKLTLEDYFDWEMEIDVKAEQTAILYPSLYLKNPQYETIYPNVQSNSADESPETTISNPTPTINQLFTDTINQSIAYTLITDSTSDTTTNTTIEGSTETAITKILELWTYPVNRSFWQFNVSPQKLAEFSSLDYRLESFNMDFSPNDQWILASIQTEDPTQESQKMYLIMESNSTNQNPVEIEELSNPEVVDPTWAQNSQYIIYSKNNELRSINIETSAQYVLYETTESNKIIWASDDSGYVYIAESQPSDNTYSILRIRTNGENRTTLIEPITSLPQDNSNLNQDNNESITDIRIGQNYLIALTTNYIHIHPIEDKPRISVKTENAQFISFSEKEERFLYITDNTLNVYTLDIDEGDPIHQTGNKVLLNLANRNISNVKWNTNDKDIFFIQTNEAEDEEETSSLKALTIDGENEYELVNNLISSRFSVGNTGKYLLTLCEDSTLCRYTLHE